MNIVMTFILHPLSHYNSITESHAQFLLSLLEHLTIDFPSHFILSIIDVHLDSVSHDKLIFPSAITRILCHFSIPFPFSDHFTIMCAINYATVKHSEAQFRSRQSDSAAPSSRSAPSRSAPSASAPSSSGDVFRRRHGAAVAHGCSPSTLSTELYQVNVRVSCNARRQATMSGFAPEPTCSPPHPVASDSDDDDDDDDDDASDDDGDVSSTDKMFT